jgi:hypothetical protein
MCKMKKLCKKCIYFVQSAKTLNYFNGELNYPVDLDYLELN